MADTFPTKQDYTDETLKNDGLNRFKEMDPQRESTFVGKAAYQKKPKRGSKGMSGSKRMFLKSKPGPGNIIKKGPR